MKKVKKKKVMVAMSGGVDSSVAAALLKKAGFDVAGVFMKCWAVPQGRASLSYTEREGDSEKTCKNLSDDEYTARRAAAKIGIPFYKFDFTREYKKKVIDYFIREYAQGRTPNPDVMCNKEIKFGLLYDRAISLGFNFVATGHYSQVRNGKFGARLVRGNDPQKDQSYFLYKIRPERFKKVIFPIGKYRKTQVRKMARNFGLPNAERKDSQGICFVGKVKLTDFLKNYIQLNPGPIVSRQVGKYGARKIVNSKMRILGYHQGLASYTIGQRKGIKLAGGPFYVLDKNIKENVLIVTRDEKDLYRKELVAENINWLSQKKLHFPLKVKARIRYRQELAPATIYKIAAKGEARSPRSPRFAGQRRQDTRYKLLFNKLQRAIAPGQSVVFYQRKELLGGGVIKN